MILDQLAKYKPVVHGLTRIVIGFLFFTHGAQKLFGWFGAEGTVEIFSRFGVAGVLEVIAGLMLLAGFFTRSVAFLLSGQMAVAYFWIHAQNGIWPWANGGELATIYCWVFLCFATAGGGAFALESVLAGKKQD